MPEATRITKKGLADGPIVVVTFDDGRLVSFMPAYGGHGDPVSIAQLKIENADEQPVAKFFSPYQYPLSTPSAPAFGWQPTILPYLTLEQIVDYLTKAQAYVGSAFAEKPRRYAHHVNIVSLADNEIRRICNGEYPLPS